MKNKERMIKTDSDWMLYWWGNKFVKRLASKRARKAEQKEIRKTVARQGETEDAG